MNERRHRRNVPPALAAFVSTADVAIGAANLMYNDEPSPVDAGNNVDTFEVLNRAEDAADVADALDIFDLI